MKIEIWSDFVCPFCYIGKRTLDLVLEQFPFRDEVELEYKSYELYPQVTKENHLKMKEILAMKHNITIAEVNDMNKKICRKAEKVGLHYRLNDILQVNTLDAHRLLKYARTKQKDIALMEAIMKAHFVDQELIDAHSVLIRLAVSSGLDEKEVIFVLSGQEYLTDVSDDKYRAASMGINQIPFFVFNSKYVLSGVSSKVGLREAIRDVWDEEHPERKWRSKQGMICTSEGCFPVE